jgi:hypothetical protein
MTSWASGAFDINWADAGEMATHPLFAALWRAAAKIATLPSAHC